MASRTRGTGGAHVRGFQGAGPTVGGHPIHGIGDIDGIDLGDIVGVLSALETKKQEESGQRPETPAAIEFSGNSKLLLHLFYPVILEKNLISTLCFLFT